MANSKRRKRPQKQKVRYSNPEMHAAMMELRQGSRTSPHRNRSRYYRPTERYVGGEW